MTTEGKTSVLKTALGLENLKGLGDTLKQIKEVMESADGLQKTLGELAKENSPIGKALAQLIEAEGFKALNAGNVTLSEEVRKKMAEELENKGKKVEELENKNKALEEDKVIHEVTSQVTAELDARLPKPGSGNDSGGSKLFKALEDVVADYLNKRLLGGDESALTSEQIRNVVREEVSKVATGGKKPEDMIEDIVNAVTMGDKLRDKLGIPGIGARLISNQGNQSGESGLRVDLVKVLLEDERERLKITQVHEVEMQKNQHLGTLATAVKENLGTGIAAITAAAEEIKGTGAKTSTPQQPQMFRCVCGTEFGPPAGWAGQPLKCPNPECGREYTKEELEA